MVYSIGGVSGNIVIIIDVGIVNDYSIAVMTITAVVIVMIVMINSNCHHREGDKIGRIKSVIIRRIVRNINGRINILNDWR